MCQEFTYTLTEPEWYTALRSTRRKAGTPRLIVQTVLLAALAVGFCGDFIWYRRGGSLFIGLVLAVLAVGQWLFPALSFRREAKALAAEARPIHLAVGEDALSVGETLAMTQPLAECTLVAADQMLLWVVDRTQSIAIPRRAVSADAWERLAACV